MKKILLVEDNPRYIAAAVRTLKGKNFSVCVAHDYNSARLSLDELKLDAAIIDCFFSRATSFGNISFGRLAIEKMAKEDHNEQRARKYLQSIEKYVNLDDLEVKTLARMYGYYHLRDDFMNGTSYNVIKCVGEINGDVATKALKEAYGVVFKNGEYKDYFGDLEKDIVKNESNQALGILVAEEAQKLELPFVLATSTYHHDSITQPIANYANKRGWTLVDCQPGTLEEKSHSEFWEKVLRELNNKLI